MGFTSVDTEIWISPFAVFLSDVSTRPDQTRPAEPVCWTGRAETLGSKRRAIPPTVTGGCVALDRSLGDPASEGDRA